MITLSQVVVVEGKYDRKKIERVIDAPILETDGFCIFKNREKRALLRRYAQSCGIVVLTDSDSAGALIRAHILSIAGENAKVTQVYIPQIKGKERRKKCAGAEGLLGVEGLSEEALSALFKRFGVGEGACAKKEPVTRLDFYEDGLLGAPFAAERRRALLCALDLPAHLSVSRMLDALNALCGKEAYKDAVSRL